MLFGTPYFQNALTFMHLHIFFLNFLAYQQALCAITREFLEIFAEK